MDLSGREAPLAVQTLSDSSTEAEEGGRVEKEKYCNNKKFQKKMEKYKKKHSSHKTNENLHNLDETN